MIRDTERAATDAWAEIARHHGIVGRVAADGTERGLTVGGSPTDVARYLAGYREAGIGEVIVVFRAPVRRRDHRARRRAPRGRSPRSADRSSTGQVPVLIITCLMNV